MVKEAKENHYRFTDVINVSCFGRNLNVVIGFSHFVDQIDLRGMEVDLALRHTLSFFRLPGEAQKIERIMQVCN